MITVERVTCFHGQDFPEGLLDRFAAAGAAFKLKGDSCPCFVVTDDDAKEADLWCMEHGKVKSITWAAEGEYLIDFAFVLAEVRLNHYLFDSDGKRATAADLVVLLVEELPGPFSQTPSTVEPV